MKFNIILLAPPIFDGRYYLKNPYNHDKTDSVIASSNSYNVSSSLQQELEDQGRSTKVAFNLITFRRYVKERATCCCN